MARTAVLASLALFIALSGPALCGLVYTADDLGAFHLPLRAFYARALENGDAFDWCPELYGGFYLTGEGQAGTYHPLHWLAYRFLPLSWAWNIECLLSYPLMFGGLWMFLRRRGFLAAEALFGAMVFTSSSFCLLHFVHVNAIAVVAHVPWLLYAADRLSRRHRSASVLGIEESKARSGLEARPRCCPPSKGEGALQPLVLIAALMGSQLLLGYPQYVLYSLVAEGVYLLFALRERSNGGEWRAAIKLSAVWSTAKLLGLALAAVQILPTFEALGDSVRQTVDSSFSASGSLHPLNVVQLVAPYLFTTRVVGQNTHELSLYVGFAPLFLAIVAIINRRLPHVITSWKTVSWFAVAMIALGGLIALGEHGPLHRILALVPFAGCFRFPCRAIVLVELGIGLLAAIGFAAVYRAVNGVQQIDLPRKSFTLVAVAGVLAAVVGPILWPEFTAEAWRVWAGPALMAIAIALVVCAAKGSRVAMHAIVVFTAIELGVYGMSYAVSRDVHSLEEYIADTPAPALKRGERVAVDLARPNGESLRAGNQVLLAGFSRIDGYAGLEPARRLDYRNPPALRLAGVAAVSAGALPDGGLQYLSAAGDGWHRVAGRLPRVRVIDTFRASDDPAREIAAIDVAREVLLESAVCSEAETHLGNSLAGLRAAGTARLLIDRPGCIVVETSSPRPSILVLAESFHRGWTATSAGRPMHVLRVNGDFLGCLVPQGRSTVEFRFAPASLGSGRLVSICSLGLLVILIAAAGAPRFRASQVH